MKNPSPVNALSGKKDRDSNMELFRCFAMFLVLIVHADFFSLGTPETYEIDSAPLATFTRLLFQALSIGCVDMFVLLSGWYGIRPKAKSFCGFIFQCAFFLFGIYTICLIFHLSDLNMHGIKGCLLLLKWNWFVRAYILLYILSPMVNAYVDTSSERQHRMMLIYFFLFQTIFSWMFNASIFFERGYSTISFIGLYLLARYFAKYKPSISVLDKKVYFMVYIISSLLIALLFFISKKYGINTLGTKLFYYNNPLVVISAFSLLLFFSKLKIRSKMVNWLGASSFAIFLLHTNPNLCKQYFIPTVRFIYTSHDGILCLLNILVFLLFLSIIAILFDQLRIVLWKKVAPIFRV